MAKTRAFAYGRGVYASNYSDVFIPVVNLEIYDKDLVSKIISKEYIGFSPQFEAEEFECTVCSQNIEDCPHTQGQVYDNVVCEAAVKKPKLVEMSVVKEPLESRALIRDLLLVENSMKLYRWHGFPTATSSDRSVNLLSALQAGLISQKAFMKFETFYSTHNESVVSYP